MKYLDTTIIADSIAGSGRAKAAADTAISSSSTWTSSHVREQFRSTFLLAAVEAHQILVDSESIGDALSRVGECFSKRQIDRESKWFGSVVDAVLTQAKEGELDDDPREAALALLERWIDDGVIMEWFEDRVPPANVLDGTGCRRAAEDPMFDVETGTFAFSPKCSKKEPCGCTVAAFVAGNMEAVAKLAEGPDELEKANQSPAHHPLRECAAMVRDKPQECRGQMCWAHFSDAIIAIECPDAAILCTTDHHFAPICDCLGKKHLHVAHDKHA
jgi:hypothetical protein